MIHRIFVAVLLFFSFISITCGQYNQIYDNVAETQVKIRCENGIQGTGTYIDLTPFDITGDYVLTAYHIVAKKLSQNEKIRVEDSKNGVMVLASLVSYDVYDTALLKLEKPLCLKRAVLSNDNVEADKKIFVFGYIGHEWLPSFQNAVRLQVMLRPKVLVNNSRFDMCAGNITIYKGMSGGAIVNESCLMVGIISSANDKLFVYANLNSILKTIEWYKNNPTTTMLNSQQFRILQGLDNLETFEVIYNYGREQQFDVTGIN